MKIVFLDQKTIGDIPALKRLNEIGTYQGYEMTASAQRIHRLKDAEVAITNKVVIDREVMENCTKLKLICVAATGMNNIDHECAKEKGIVVRNVSGYSTHSVAQHTFSMLLYLLNQIRHYDDYVQGGEYAGTDIFTYIGPQWWELHNKRFGIIGLGTIGKRVAEIAAGFGAEVVYYSTSGKNDDPVFKRVDLEDLLQTCDVISIHAPLNEHTRHLIGTYELGVMKKHAILLNTGRGGIVNEQALADALNSNKLAAAGIDVLEQEPIDLENPLLKVSDKSKLLITPHIAWSSVEARQKLIEGVIQNIKEVMG